MIKIALGISKVFSFQISKTDKFIVEECTWLLAVTPYMMILKMYFCESQSKTTQIIHFSPFNHPNLPIPFSHQL